jgi:hypothetical protein
MTSLVAEERTARAESERTVLKNAIAATQQGLDKAVSNFYALSVGESARVAISAP